MDPIGLKFASCSSLNSSVFVTFALDLFETLRTPLLPVCPGTTVEEGEGFMKHEQKVQAEFKRKQEFTDAHSFPSFFAMPGEMRTYQLTLL